MTIGPEEYLDKMTGLRYGVTPDFQLNANNVVEMGDLNLFLPVGWNYFQGNVAKEKFPFQLTAITDIYNDSFTVMQSPLTSGIEISAIVLSDDQDGQNVGKKLKQHMNSIAKEVEISDEHGVAVAEGTGYFIDARVLVQYFGKQGTVTMNGANVSSRHFYALRTVAGKKVVLHAGNFGFFGSNYRNFNKTIFMEMASNVQPKNEPPNLKSSLPEYEVEKHIVQAGETIGSLTQNLGLSNAGRKLRLINAVPADQDITAGQFIKRIKQL